MNDSGYVPLRSSPEAILPRHAPVSAPRPSMSSLNRCRFAAPLAIPGTGQLR